jgi:hypothetical protein
MKFESTDQKPESGLSTSSIQNFFGATLYRKAEQAKIILDVKSCRWAMAVSPSQLKR